MTTDRLNIFNHLSGTPIDEKSVAVKANIAVADLPHTGGIKAYSSVAREHALVVKRLLDAGYNVAGLVNMEEGALGAQTDNPWFGKTHNPLKYGYTAGGSSGGSAAAVAAGRCQLALGTDTMGSVRIPSAYCGIWGFKPSYEPDMLKGVMSLSHSLDTVGVHGQTLPQTAALCEIITGRNFAGGAAGQIYVLNVAGKVDVEADVAACFNALLRKIGTLPRTDLAPYQFGASRRLGLILSEVEGYATHAARLETHPDGFSPFFKKMLEYGRDLPLEKINEAYAHLETMREAQFPDFILMPSAPQTAFQFGVPVPANQADFTAFANLADRPAIQFPIGVNHNGLPIGAQLVGPRGGEADLMATMTQLWAQIN